MLGAQVQQLFVFERQVVDHVPESDGGGADPRLRAGWQVVAFQQRLAAAVQLEQLVLDRGGGPAEQVGGGAHGQPPIGLSRRSTVRRAFSSKRGSSPGAARSTSKRRPSCVSASALARCSEMSCQDSSEVPGGSSIRSTMWSR